MGTWKATQIPLPPQLPPGGQIDMSYVKTLNDYVKQLAHTISSIRNDLEFMLNGNLDVKNIRANSITADRLDVDELSAITANVGKVTSGEIYGNYISTKEDGYPRAEMSNTDDFFGVYKDANNYVQMRSVAVDIGSPQFIMVSPVGSLSLYQQANVSDIYAFNSEVRLTAERDIVLRPGSPAYYVRMPFEQVLDTNKGTSLFAQLLDKATKGSQTGSSGSANGGIPIGTVLRTADGGTVTWTGISNHTHTQN